MLLEQPVDLLDPLDADLASQREALETAFHRQQRGFGQTGVGDLGREPDVVVESDVTGNQHLAALDDQHIRTKPRLLFVDVGWSRDVTDDRAGLALADVQDALPERRGRSDDQIAALDRLLRTSGHLDTRFGSLLLDRALERNQLLRLDRHQHHVVNRLRQHSRANRPD